LYRVTGESKTRRLQRAFAAHLRRLGGRYPKDRYARVVILIDNAPWHAGELIREALADHPHFWKLLRRRATHNRLFESLADLKRSIRNSLRYFQTVRRRVQTLIAKCYPRPENRTASSGP
jgi:hypothetical protein